jgi:hypothetical protein
MLSWPALLRSEDFAEDRARIEAVLGPATEKAAHGRVDAGTPEAISKYAKELEMRLVLMAKIMGETSGWSAGDYIEAKRFLHRLDDALKFLRQPQVERYGIDVYAARGKSVAELVRYMGENGLRFAPAVTGNEAAYLALQRALAAYDLQAHAASSRANLEEKAGGLAAIVREP